MATTIKKARGKKRRSRPGRQEREEPGGLTKVQREFLETYRAMESPTIGAACVALGIDKTAHYRHWLKQPVYKAAWDEVAADLEEKNKADALALMKELGDPKRGWTEETIEEEVVPNADGKLIVIRAHRKTTKRFSVAAAIWEANRKWGNPQRLEVTGKDGGPIENRVSLAGLWSLIAETKDAPPQT